MRGLDGFIEYCTEQAEESPWHAEAAMIARRYLGIQERARDVIVEQARRAASGEGVLSDSEVERRIDGHLP